jgi:hypothetical protein
MKRLLTHLVTKRPEEIMSELIQEYVDSSSQRLRVDRAAGVIRGVKLLGLRSRNGRRYRENALIEAIGLYEGAKVNTNHPKGHPLAPRDYQDRLGVVRGVKFRANEGLFGDLHFNPRHALSEQLVWDAEHAPQNVGMSHNVLARTKQLGDETVVEAITKVQSIDLVADPATTSGLYEHATSQESRDKSQEPENGNSRPAFDSKLLTFDSLTLDELRLHRPDLIRAIEVYRGAELKSVQQQLDEAKAREATARRRELVAQLLQEHELPMPASSEAVDSGPVSPQFFQALIEAGSDAEVRELIEERAALLRSARAWSAGRQQGASRPRSRHQFEFPFLSNGAVRTAAEFAAAVRGG